MIPLDSRTCLMLLNRLIVFIAICILGTCSSFQYAPKEPLKVKTLNVSAELSLKNRHYLNRFFIVDPKSTNILSIQFNELENNYSYSSSSVKPTQSIINIQAEVIFNNNQMSSISFKEISQRSIPILESNPVANTQLKREYLELMHREIINKIYLKLSTQ